MLSVSRISVQTLVNNKNRTSTGFSRAQRPAAPISVTGLLSDDYGLFIPFSGNRATAGGDPSCPWQNPFHVGYVELQPCVTPADLEQPSGKLVSKYAPDGIRENLVVRFGTLSDYYQKANNGAVEKMMFTLSLVGLFILAMAVINFVNLSIRETSFGRLKEIGLPQSVGWPQSPALVGFSFIRILVLTACAAILGTPGLLGPARVFNRMHRLPFPPLTGLGWQGPIGFFAVTGLACWLGSNAGAQRQESPCSRSRKIQNICPQWHPGAQDVAGCSVLTDHYRFVAAVAISRQVNHIFNKGSGI